MADSPEQTHESSLDAYLDGTVGDAERASWDQRLQGDEELRMHASRQHAIDAMLRRTFVPDDQASQRCLYRLRQQLVGPTQPQSGAERVDEPRIPTAKPPAALHRKALAWAAALALCVLAGWQVKQTLFPTAPSVYVIQKWRSMDRIYFDEVARGFRPGWVCTDDAGFAQATRREVGQAMVLAQAPGLTVLGWSYANTLSPNTLYLLTKADDASVLVFMHPVDHEAEPVVEPESGLHLHHRTLGRVHLYEVSPHLEARVLPYFREASP